MTITVGSVTFGDVYYDADADVLYLPGGDPSVAVGFDESPKGRASRSDAERNLVGATVLRSDAVAPALVAA